MTCYNRYIALNFDARSYFVLAIAKYSAETKFTIITYKNRMHTLLV